MKLLYKDKGLVIAIIPETSTLYSDYENDVNVEKVANNTSVSIGQTKYDGEPAANTSTEDWILKYGSQKSLEKFVIEFKLGDLLTEALNTASDEIKTYWQSIGKNDDVILDDTCLILTLFDDMIKTCY